MDYATFDQLFDIAYSAGFSGRQSFFVALTLAAYNISPSEAQRLFAQAEAGWLQ
jgi:hypothetical protein